LNLPGFFAMKITRYLGRFVFLPIRGLPFP